MRAVAFAALALALLAPSSRAAPPDELATASVIFARGSELVRSDARGNQETVVARLPSKVTVRALRSDAKGSVLLADLGGKWFWMPLGAAGTLTPLACGNGPAQLAEDGACVLCRNPKSPAGSIIINLKTKQTTAVAIPTQGSRLVTAPVRKLVWADKTAVWSARPDLKQKTRVAPEPPLRSFIASPDGSRAFGVYSDYLYEGAKKKVPTELLMGFALDGTAARRKAFQHGVPIEWSHDGQYVLVQDGSAACLMRATGGQYKCWKGFTAVSLAPDGAFALVLGNRDGSKQKSEEESKANEDTEDAVDDSSSTAADVAVPLPTGELALYVARLGGPHSLAPKLVTKIVDGAALWLPQP